MSRHFGYTYHSHTRRCGHAKGTEKEMIETAIAHGYKVFGISDHVFLPGIFQPKVRGGYDENYKEYIDNLRKLKEKYSKTIEFYRGFECEDYGELFLQYYLDMLRNDDVDYLLLGQHCCMGDNGKLFWYGFMEDKDEAVRLYTKHLIEGMESGLYAYVCHPDVFTKFIEQWDEVCEECSKAIIEKAIELDIPLEINMTPSRTEVKFDGNGNRVFSYPNDDFWRLVSQLKAKCIIGVDAHAPEHLYNSDFTAIRQFIRRHRLKPIKRIDIVSYREKLFKRYGLDKNH